MIIIQKSYFLSIVIFLMLIITYDESLGLFTKYFEKIWSRQKMTKLNVLQTINFLFIEKNKTISNQFEIKVRIWEFQFMSQLVSTSMLIQRPAFLVTAWLPETLSLSLSLHFMQHGRKKRNCTLNRDGDPLVSTSFFKDWRNFHFRDGLDGGSIKLSNW